MIRRPSRFALVLSIVGVGAGAAYGCGGGDEGPGGDPGEGGAQDGPITLDDGAVILPDGAVVHPDGASPVDGASDAGDGASEAAVDAGPDATVPPPGPLSPGYVDYDVNHIIMTGQSNALANETTAPITTTEHTNLMFNAGPAVGANPTSFVPLKSGGGGLADLAMADRITKFAKESFDFGVDPANPTKHDILISNNARSGWTYWCLRKGGCTYQGGGQPWIDAMGQVSQGKALAAAEGKTFVVRGVTNIHGESEHTSYKTNSPEFPLDGTDGGFKTIKDYADALVEWQRDYEADVKAITGQAEPVPMFITQLSGWNDIRYSQVPQFQYLAHKRAPGKVIIVGASYPMQFFSDCRHYNRESQRKIGEYFAKVYQRVVFQGLPWEPVRPMTVTRAGNVVTVKYYVPVPPLHIDTARIQAISQYGFDFVDDGVFIPITNVAVGGDTVTLTLASTPAGASKKLRYGQNQVPGTCQGTGSDTGAGPGARGNIRDSDGTVSRYGYELHNWGIVFEEDVP